MKQLKLGIIGLSDGNGHPYSWSAIFNGYNPEVMKDCPFPVIPQYLGKQKFPEDTIKEAKVTHIWTQDKTISKHVAEAARIENIVDNYTDLIGKVDGVLLARDDAELHFEMSEPFIKAGMPIYIDKPLAADIETAQRIYSLEQFKGQVFTCSAISYAKEFQLSEKDKEELGNINYVDAIVPKSWEKYSVHIIEPVLRIVGNQGQIKKVNKIIMNDIQTVTLGWESGLTTTFSTLGKNIICPITIRLYGSKGYRELYFEDTFYAFKKALEHFISIMLKEDKPQNREDVLSVIKIIEAGK